MVLVNAFFVRHGNDASEPFGHPVDEGRSVFFLGLLAVLIRSFTRRGFLFFRFHFLLHSFRFGEAAQAKEAECGRAGGRFECVVDGAGQAVDRVADAGAALQDKLGEVREVFQLGAAAGQHDRLDGVGIARLIDGAFDRFEDILGDAGVDNGGEVAFVDFERLAEARTVGDGDKVVGVGHFGEAVAVVDLEVFGLFDGNRNILNVGGDGLAADGDDLDADGEALVVDDEVAGTAADVDEGDAVEFFLFGEAHVAGGDRLEHKAFGLQAGAGDAEGDSSHLFHIAGNHLVVADEVLAEGAHGIGKAFAFHIIILRDDGDHLGAFHIHASELAEHILHLLFGHHFVEAVGAQGAVGAAHAFDVAAGDTDIDFADRFLDAGCQLVEGHLNVLDGAAGAEHATVFDTGGQASAVAAHVDFPVAMHEAGDHQYFRCTDVESHNHFEGGGLRLYIVVHKKVNWFLFYCVDSVFEAEVEGGVGSCVEESVGVGGVEVGEFVGEVVGGAEEDSLSAEDAIEFDLAVGSHEDFGVLGGVVLVAGDGFGHGIGAVQGALLLDEGAGLAVADIAVDDQQVAAARVVGEQLSVVGEHQRGLSGGEHQGERGVGGDGDGEAAAVDGGGLDALHPRVLLQHLLDGLAVELANLLSDRVGGRLEDERANLSLRHHSMAVLVGDGDLHLTARKIEIAHPGHYDQCDRSDKQQQHKNAFQFLH